MCPSVQQSGFKTRTVGPYCRSLWWYRRRTFELLQPVERWFGFGKACGVGEGGSLGLSRRIFLDGKSLRFGGEPAPWVLE